MAINQYGQAENVAGTLLEVDTVYSHWVSVKLHAPQNWPRAYLNPHEVDVLIAQLETWLANSRKVCPTCGK